MTLRVHRIDNMQTADINHLSDNIYFAGCSVDCPFCFNKEVAQSEGKSATIPDILDSLSDIEWVCFMGGDPLDQDHKQLKELSTVLHKFGKKVCIFTAWKQPWLYVKADHYHIDVKVFKRRMYVRPPQTMMAESVSYGVVSQNYSDMNTRLAFMDLLNHAIYVKTDLMDKSHDGQNEYQSLKSMGAINIYIDKKIDVDNNGK